MIFNAISAIELLIGALIAAPVAGILWAFDFDFTFWLLIIALGLTVPMDAVYRRSQMAGDEENGVAGSPWAPIAPRRGGHLFFIPMWILGIVLPVLFTLADVF